MVVNDGAPAEGEQPRAEWVKPKLQIVPLKEAMGGGANPGSVDNGLYS